MNTIIPDWLLARLKFKAPKEDDEAAFPPLEKICYKDYPCGDCGKMLEQQRIVEIRLLNKPNKHWQYSCKSCGKYRNPETGEYCLTNQQLRAKFYRPNSKIDKY
jgi:hypothetical protein